MSTLLLQPLWRPSVSKWTRLSVRISGWPTNLSVFLVVIGKKAGAAPTTFGELTDAGISPKSFYDVEQAAFQGSGATVQLRWLAQPLNAATVGDHIWVGAVNVNPPVSGTPLLAVAGPFTAAA